jgi:hypothetical protein
MAGLSRRTFLQSSAAAAAGAAVIGVPISSALAAGTTKSAPVAGSTGVADAVGGQASGPLVVWVSDASAGDVSILVGEDEVTYHDPDLVARLARAAARKS